jgi:hypothetical protein
MKRNQKGFIVGVLVVMIALIAGGGAYMYTQKQKSTPGNSEMISAKERVNTSSNTSEQPQVKTGVEQKTPAPATDTIDKADCSDETTCLNSSQIQVSIADTAWKVGNIYRVSWTNSSPTKGGYYYVSLGVGTSTKKIITGGGDGSWMVEGTKNYIDIELTERRIRFLVHLTENQDFKSIKDAFFVRVQEFDENEMPAPQDDIFVTAADSSFFSVREYRGFGTEEYASQPVDLEKQAMVQSDANATAILLSLHPYTDTYYSKENNRSFTGFCASEKAMSSIARISSLVGEGNIVCKDDKENIAMTVRYKHGGYDCLRFTNSNDPKDSYYFGKATSFNTGTVCNKYMN